MTPAQAEQDINQEKLALMNERYVRKRKFKKRTPKFKKGQHVRIKKSRTSFFKGYKERFQEEIYLISEVKTHLPVPLYVLTTLNNKETILGHFYESELVAVSKNPEFRIEKVLKEKGNKVFVKWRSYPSSENSWIPKSNVRQIDKKK